MAIVLIDVLMLGAPALSVLGITLVVGTLLSICVLLAGRSGQDLLDAARWRAEPCAQPPRVASSLSTLLHVLTLRPIAVSVFVALPLACDALLGGLVPVAMLLPHHIDHWVSHHGRWLYHTVLHPIDLPFVLTHGLQTRTSSGQTGNHTDMRSFEDRIYFATSPDEGWEAGVGSSGPHFRVDISTLAPERIESDEDCVGAYDGKTVLGTPRLRDHLSHLPEFEKLAPWPGTYAEGRAWYLANRKLLNQPEWVLHSLGQGRCAVLGDICFSQLEDIDGVGERWVAADPGDLWKPWSASSGRDDEIRKRYSKT